MEEGKKLTEAELQLIHERIAREELERQHRFELVRKDDNHAWTIGLLALAIVILVGIILGP
jgi:hypothetical protein